MKKIRLFLSLIFLLSSSFDVSAQTDLEALYQKKQFFELRDQLKNLVADKSPKILFYRGAIANKFNRPDESTKFLQEFVQITPKQGNEQKLTDALELLANNFIKTYQYKRAVANLQILINDYRNELDEDRFRDITNDYKLFSALADIPPQTVSFNGDTQIEATRDKAKLLNIPVEINDQRINFVFDTGANISTITASTAKKMNLQPIEADFDVGSSTKERVKSKLAVAPKLKIGNVTVNNAVFLVFEDSALAFPQINYQIDGVIGFPVIEAMRKVTITKQDLMTIPAQSEKKTAIQNLCLDGLLPLIQGTYNNEKMIFAFDTGAVTSTLHPPFYEAEKEQVVKNYKPQKTKLGGAGGSQEVETYVIKNVSLNIGGKTAIFPQISLITEVVNNETRDFYGNLGQDLIKQFGKMTLDFEAMSIIFE